jgi:tetratricopeptide (TPR) repeat protein
MIAANPDSREALIAHYQFLKLDGDQEAARAALDKAYEQDPKDLAVLTFKGIESVVDFQNAFKEAEGTDAEKRKAGEKHLDTAAKYFSDAIEYFPERMDLYERAARVELFREKPEQALAIIQKGIDKFPLKTSIEQTGLPRAIHLENLKFEILFGQKRFDEFRAELKALRTVNNPRVQSVAEFHEGRLMAIEEKWAEAAAAMQKVRSNLVGFPDLEGLAGVTQGFAHTQLGQFDLALAAYKWALSKNPNMPQAQVGAEEMARIVQPDAQDNELTSLDDKIKKTLALPAAQQDWDAIQKEMDQYITDEAAKRPVAATWAQSRKQLMRGQMFAMRAGAETDPVKQKSLYQEARNAIVAASKIDPKDPQIQITAINLLAQEPSSGPQKALAQLDNIVNKLHGGKETLQFRRARVDLLGRIGGEDLPAKLEEATKGMEDWPANQQAMIWAAVAGVYEQTGRAADAQRSLEKAVDLAPNSLPLRMSLFDMSLKQSDDAGMRRAQERILEIVKSKSDPGYVLTEIKRRIVGANTGAVGEAELKEARTLINQAIRQRPNWSELHVASGQLYRILEKDNDKALASFEEASKHGATNANAVALQVRLLADRGRLADARQRMNSIPEQAWSAVLDRAAAEVLVRSGEKDKALAEAKKVADSRPEDAALQLWYGDIATQAEKADVAEAAYKKGVELNPTDPDAWSRLITTYITLKRPDDVMATLREAHLALDEEFLPLLSARYFEMQSRWQEAEDIYLTAYANRVDEIPVARRLAEFYLTWSKNNDANRNKAGVYINRILRASYEGKLPKDDPNFLWARRQAAKSLATTREYQDSVKAERMLAAAVEDGSATAEDREQLVDILSLRNDPGSRDRVVQMLRQMKQEQGLTPERELHLGHMLNEIDQWQQSKEQMEEAIGRYPNDVRLQTAYTSMLISRKEFAAAKSWIGRLDDRRENAGAVGELRLRLASAQGDKDEVRKILTSMTPNLNTLNEQQLQFLRSLVQLADGVDDHEYALKMMQEYARRVPGNELELARFTLLYGDIDQGLSLLQGQFETRMDDVLSVALEGFRKRRSEAQEKLDAEITRMIRLALRDDPESARRLVFEAEMLEVQEKFDESIAAYNKLLARDDVPKIVRATALNNLAFILALQSKRPEDLELALRSSNQAVEILGPLSDILDTRALVYIASNHFEDAVADMRLSVMVSPTPSKYYHLAVAELGAGNEAAAKAAWARAKADGIGPDKVSQLERAALDGFSRKMDGLGSGAPTAQL